MKAEYITPENLSILEGVQELTALCYSRSYHAGWWHDPKTNEEFLDTVHVIATKLCLIHSEISEAMEGYRKNKKDDHLPNRPMVEVELADAVIRIMDLAGRLSLDLAGAILEKLEYNSKRPDHKPENRAKAGGKAF